jgi:hypothetical protein
MSVDDFLFILIIGGMVLAIAYLRAQYAVRRSYRIAEHANTLRLRELYGTRAKTQDLRTGPAKPVSSAAVPQMLPNAVLHRSLPVHVRFVYRAPAAIGGTKGMAGWTDLDAPRSTQSRGN